MTCFNPRAREGRDTFMQMSSFLRQVSIHAPARGATVIINQIMRHLVRFNPRAREGRDPASDIRRPQRHLCFNPRAREGRDQGNCKEVKRLLSFNPRAREGRDSRLSSGFLLF